MKTIDVVAAVLLVIGGLNWGLVGLFEFDLVAAIFGGMQFGEVNLASRLIYLLVGIAGLYQIVQLRGIQRRWHVEPQV